MATLTAIPFKYCPLKVNSTITIPIYLVNVIADMKELRLQDEVDWGVYRSRMRELGVFDERIDSLVDLHALDMGYADGDGCCTYQDGHCYLSASEHHEMREILVKYYEALVSRDTKQSKKYRREFISLHRKSKWHDAMEYTFDGIKGVCKKCDEADEVVCIECGKRVYYSMDEVFEEKCKPYAKEVLGVESLEGIE